MSSRRPSETPSLLREDASAATAADPSSAPTGWLIGPRLVRPPATASVALRDSLQQAPAPQSPPVPATLEEWKASIAARDAENSALARQAAAELGVTVEPDSIAGVGVHRVSAPQIALAHAAHLFVHIHGGSFIHGAGLAGVAEAIQLASFLRLPAISIDYRMAPADPAPAAASGAQSGRGILDAFTEPGGGWSGPVSDEAQLRRPTGSPAISWGVRWERRAPRRSGPARSRSTERRLSRAPLSTPRRRAAQTSSERSADGPQYVALAGPQARHGHLMRSQTDVTQPPSRRRPFDPIRRTPPGSIEPRLAPSEKPL